MSPRFHILLVLILPLLAACSGGSSSPSSTPTGTPAPAREGVLYVGRDAAIVRVPLDGSDPTVLIPPQGPAIVAADPAFSPDGTHLAFVRRLPLHAIVGGRDVSSDLWLASADGTEPRALVVHTATNERLLHPQWRDDAHLYVVVQRQRDSADLATTTFSLEAIDASTGARTAVLSDVAAFDQTLTAGFTYSVATRSPFAGSIFVVGSPGAAPTPILTPAEPLGFVSAPRFSPDGGSVAYTAVDRTAYINATDDNPVPMQLFIAPRSGGSRRHVADVDAELPPAIAWSGDGKYIYLSSDKGLVEVSVESGEVRTILESTAVIGDVIWRKS